ncbi:UNVERIFIED_CONTAM: hypothetical protein FKN15_026480 [Acipenser sinensis]
MHILSVAACEEVGEQELVFPSEDVESLSENHRPSPQQLDELRLVNKNLFCMFKLNGQAVGRNLAALVAAHEQIWLSQAPVPDGDKALLLDTPITPGHTFGPAVDEMLQRCHRAQESMKELVQLLPKRPPPVHNPAANWRTRPLQPQRPAQPAAPAARGAVQNRPVAARSGL